MKVQKYTHLSSLNKILVDLNTTPWYFYQVKSHFQFSIGQIKEDIFWRLLDKGEIPRIMLVNDRRVKKVWDETVPTEEMIRAENP